MKIAQSDSQNLIIVGDPVTRRVIASSSDIPVLKVVGEVQFGLFSRFKAPMLRNAAHRLNLLLIHWHLEPVFLGYRLFYCVLGRESDVKKFWQEIEEVQPKWHINRD